VAKLSRWNGGDDENGTLGIFGGVARTTLTRLKTHDLTKSFDHRLTLNFGRRFHENLEYLSQWQLAKKPRRLKP